MSVVESTMSASSGMRGYEEEQFNYRPIPVLVPISLAFVFLSLVGAVLAELLVVPAIGMLLAFLAIRQIQASRGSLSGRPLAFVALIAQAGMIAGFGLLHTYTFATEVPPGFERINFTADISNKGFVNHGAGMGIHPDVQQLDHKKIMVKGYMYPTKEQDHLKSFVLCRDSGQCCFGGQPKTTDMILVHMSGTKDVHFRTGLVAVAGEFVAEPTVDETGLQPVYQLKCEHFGPAKTWY